MTIISFILSILAGLSSLIGILFIYIKKDKEKIIKYSLSFASGVMICISTIDLLPESIKLLNQSLQKERTFTCTLIFIIIGFIIPSIINKLLKKQENKLYRVGVLSMIAIIVHNIPEGIATFLSAETNIKLGIAMTISIAIHNIPEGISVAIPIYYGTNNKQKAFLTTIISAMSEPFGALLAFLFLKPIITNQIMGIILAIITGIMSNISLTELLPQALNYKEQKKTIFFFIIGFLFMYLSISLMK